ncbi:MAG: hypothetical protein AB8G26_08190 [Ilumatobacter sp.]
MKRWIAVLAAVLAVVMTVACSGSDAGGREPVDEVTSATEPPGSITSQEAQTTIDTTLVTGPEDTELPAPERVVDDPDDEALPPLTDAAPSEVGVPTSDVAMIYAGTGRAGEPWAPVGWWDGGSWQQLDDLADPIAPAPQIPTVSLTGLDLPEGRDPVIEGLELGPSEPYCVNDELGPVIDFTPDVPDTPTSLGYDVVAVTADWPLQPRPVRRGGLDDEQLAGAALDLLPGLAEATDGQLAQVVVVDLDGDGLDETLVSVERQTDPQGAPGDFAVIMVRTSTPDGGADDAALVAVEVVDPATLEIPFPTAQRHTIAAIADLNGDGVMEVVVRNRFFESAGVEVFGYVDGVIEPLGLTGGCGV